MFNNSNNKSKAKTLEAPKAAADHRTISMVVSPTNKSTCSIKPNNTSQATIRPATPSTQCPSKWFLKAKELEIGEDMPILSSREAHSSSIPNRYPPTLEPVSKLSSMQRSNRPQAARKLMLPKSQQRLNSRLLPCHLSPRARS